MLDVLDDGGKEEACKLLEAMRDLGIAREKQATKAIGYLRNIDLIAVEGPSLGTMESENQHLYGARMDSVPCARSQPGASAMARVVSRKHSRREIPRMTRSRSLTPKRAKQRGARIIAAMWPKGAGKMVESTIGMVVLALAVGFVISFAVFLVMNLSTWLTSLLWNGATGDTPTPWFPLAVCTLGGALIGAALPVPRTLLAANAEGK